ncbi:hypothetical protein [Methanoplanus limicola]|uniref:Uncharacterized protein n=1 Tax=Methanoplanus limicola DSM 2279 TaxID=937775 RepID=H1Z0G0_9EURY|nr:hypothetical protein [Methanoplanus limicola]EHQ34427.1 hypothetical protein Metlim_0285 [Methanoplanus limicola DSM 2279]
MKSIASESVEEKSAEKGTENMRVNVDDEPEGKRDERRKGPEDESTAVESTAVKSTVSESVEEKSVKKGTENMRVNVDDESADLNVRGESEREERAEELKKAESSGKKRAEELKGGDKGEVRERLKAVYYDFEAETGDMIVSDTGICAGCGAGTGTAYPASNNGRNYGNNFGYKPNSNLKSITDSEKYYISDPGKELITSPKEETGPNEETDPNEKACPAKSSGKATSSVSSYNKAADTGKELDGGMYPLFLLPKRVSDIIKEHGNNFRTMNIRRTGRHNYKISFTIAER